jgi:cysteine desulfurase/selenocysteine lyase
MSDLRLEPGLLHEAPADPFAGLIAKLANEIFNEGPQGVAAPETFPSSENFQQPVAPPTTAAGVPSNFSPPSKASQPPSQTPPQGSNIDLSGGFPSSHNPDAPPPVHPTVVSAEPQEAVPGSGTPQGSHIPGSSDSHEFGEPTFKTWERRTPEQPRTIWDTDHASILPEATDYYFLQHLAPAPSGIAFPKTEPSAPFTSFDIGGVRRDFPALHQRVNGHPLVWLDNAATTHKPQSVIDATSRFYGRDNSNIHRAAHTLAGRSTELFESGREKVRQFLGAADSKEIVFVRGTTEGINLVAQSWGRKNVGAGDEILISNLEHHANIVPWQLLAEQTGASLRVIPMNDRGELILEELPNLLTDKTKIVSVTQVSNALGTINPVEEIIALAHSRGIPVLVDGAQSTPHIPINVQAMDADFFVFSGHKVFGPTGIGALYGKSHLLEEMPPWQGGGHMIKDVTFERTIYNHAPEKFEAGTPDIAGVVGLGAAIDYMFQVGIPAIAAYEHSLLEYATPLLHGVPGVRPIGTAHHKASVLGFVIPGISNEKIAKHLDQQGIAVRGGHHCAMPALRHFGVESTVRPSLAFYNTFAEIDLLIAALHQLVRH